MRIAGWLGFLGNSREPEGLPLWRERFLHGIYLMGAVCGPFILIPVIMFMASNQKWVVLYVDILLYAWVLVCALLRARIPFWLRKNISLAVSFCMGAVVLANMGPYSGGSIWLFSFGVFSGVFAGIRGALAALLLNACTFLLLGYLAGAGYLSWSDTYGPDHSRWGVLAANFFLLSGMVSIIVAGLSKGLQRALDHETEAKEQLQSEQKRLALSESQYRLLAQNISDVVWTVDTSLVYTYVSPSMETVFGFAPYEVVGRKFGFNYAPQDREKLMACMAQIVNDPSLNPAESCLARIYETQQTSKNGAIVWTEVQVGVLWDDSGEVVGVLGVGRDVSAQRRLAGQLRQSQKMEALGTLSGGIAHDFNNILGAISGYTELALEDAQNGKPAANELSQVLKVVNRGRALVNQILIFSRKKEPELKRLDLNRLVEGTADFLSRTIPRMIQIDLDLEHDLDQVMADHTQLEQVLFNLVSNSKDAMPDGGQISIGTSMTHLSPEFCRENVELNPGPYVELKVRDSGRGMNSEVLSRIFDPFFTTKHIGEGTGLGLSTVYGIIKGHNSQVQVDSRPGLGTEFRIFLPSAAAGHMEAAAPAQTGPEVPGKGETILIVDDELDMCAVTSEILKRSGYQVCLANSGEDALQVYEKSGIVPDLVLLDLSMPGMGGLKCLEYLLELDPEVRVIIASGYSAEAKPSDTIPLGAKSYISKPFSRDDLLREIARVLNSQ